MSNPKRRFEHATTVSHTAESLVYATPSGSADWDSWELVAVSVHEDGVVGYWKREIDDSGGVKR